MFRGTYAIVVNFASSLLWWG